MQAVAILAEAQTRKRGAVLEALASEFRFVTARRARLELPEIYSPTVS